MSSGFKYISKSLLAVSLCVLFLPQVAHADPKDDARRHFAAGLEAAKDQRFADALEFFNKAQDAYPHPNTLFNIARAHQDMGDLTKAIEYYEFFQQASPDKAADADPIIQVLTARLARQSETSEPNNTPTTTSRLADSDIAQLREIAGQLQELTAALEERAIKPDTPPVDPIGPTTTPVEPIDEGGFRSQAYERIVVTASRYGQDPLDSPSTISVISTDDIRLSGATTVPDLLRRVVGVDVMSLASSQPDVSIRGFNRELSNKVLVLIDGRSVYWDFIGTTFWSMLPITIEEIERVEVIRGPGSAVYGANAVTGVINIITKTPGEATGTTLRADFGYPGYINGSAYTSGNAADISYRFSAKFRQDGRWNRAEIIPANSPLDFNLEDPNRAQEVGAINGRLDRRFGDKGFVSMSGGFSEGYAEYYSLGVLGDSVAENRHHYLRTDAGYGPLLFRMFWNHDTGHSKPVTSPKGASRSLSSDYIIDTVDIELGGNGEFETGAVSHTLSGGIGYRRKSIKDFQFLAGDVIEHHGNAYLNEEAAIGPVKLVGSMRLDVHPLIQIDKTLSPRGAAILRVADNSSIRLTGGTAFRAPNMLESYMDFSLGTSADGVFVRDFGSTEIIPERIITAELGFHDESTLYHTADAVVYYNRVSDVIGLAPVTPASGPFDESNAGFLAGTTGWVNTDPIYDGAGVEAAVEFFPIDGLDLYANANLAWIFETEAGQTLRDRSISNLKLNAGASYRTPYRTDISLDAHYVSAQEWRLRGFDDDGQISITTAEIPARLILSARVGVRPLPKEDLEFAVTLWNGLGFSESARFREHPNGQLVGPRLFGSVTYRF